MKVYSKALGIATANIPAEPKSYPSWVVWRYEQTDKPKPRKVLYTPGLDRRASTIDLRTWRTFNAAVESYEAGGYDGIGFVFSSGDPFAGIDLDGCRDPETGDLEPWAQKIVDVAGGYAEVSPSGRGVHIIVRGKAPNSKRGPVEAYSERRFFTMTGCAL